MRPPVLLAFLLADKVFREMETGKVHVAGTFNQLSTNQFPLVHNQFFVYLCLSSLKSGTCELKLEMHYIDTGLKILKVEQPIQSPGPADVLELNMCFNHVKFEQEGTVELILSYEGEAFATRTLSISKLNIEGPPPPQA